MGPSLTTESPAGAHAADLTAERARPGLLAPRLGLTLALAAVYTAAAKLGLALAFVADQVSVVWPATGIALAALLVFGMRAWPGIALGAFVGNATAGESVLVALGIAAGNTLEAVAGAWIMRRAFGFRRDLGRARDALAFIACGGIVAPVVSATIGVTSLSLGELVEWPDFGRVWSVWWVGDCVGALAVAPALLMLDRWRRLRLGRARLLELIALLVGLGLLSHFVVAGGLPSELQHQPFEYLVFPFVIWAAFRFGPPATTLAVLLPASIAIFGCLRGVGPFVTASVHESLFLLQMFNGVVAVTGLVLASALAERDTAGRHRAVGQAVARVLAERRPVEGTLAAVLGIVGDALDWDVGAIWRAPADGGPLRCGDVRACSDIQAPAFERATRASTFASGIGLPGRVHASRRPAWIEDVARDGNFPRAQDAVRDGLKGAFGFPLLVGDRCIGVIEFFSRARRERDEALLELMAGIGSQIGHFIARSESDAALRRSEERFALAQRATGIGTFEWDVVDGAIVWTDAMEHLHGLPRDSFDGTLAAWEERIHPDERGRVLAELRAAGRGDGELRTEYRVPLADGGERWVAAMGRSFADEAGRVRLVGALIDVTARKLAERDLEDAARRKDEFLAMLSHELRNPLAPLANALELMRGEPSDASLLEVAERQVQHMTRLVDDLLDVSRITRGRIRLVREGLDLRDIVQRAVEAAGPFAAARRTAIRVDLPDDAMPVTADATRLVQVFTNLLNNAIKFGPQEGGEVAVTARAAGGESIVTVRDGGCGIAREMLGRVFDLFIQVDSGLDRATGGLGIGLTLVRRLIELHGGSVAAQSDGPGCGSTFTVRLPLAAHAAPANEPPRPRAEPQACRRVLVVDDNVDAAESLALLLRRRGHEVQVAYDGLEALARLDTFTPDVALLDLGLPSVDGFELARRIRRRLPNVRLVAVSGYGSEEDRRSSAAAGFDQHVVKPLFAERLEIVLSGG